MKTTLLASTALVLSVGAAAAADFTMADTGHDHSITLSGDARMGVTNDHDGSTDDAKFTSRARVKFTGAGETDGGLGFGFSFRAGDASGAASGNNGSVFISQGGHTLAMGDVDSAAKAAVGNVSTVGLTELSNYNEVDYDLNDETPALLYSYTGGALSFHVGIDNVDNGFGPSQSLGGSYSLGVAYDAGTFNVALGYESDGKWDDTGAYLGLGADLGAVALQAVIADSDDGGDQWAVSADFTSGATTFTGFIADDNGSDSWGLGASHDLGGGASLVGGVVDSDNESDLLWDFGVAMTF